MEYKDPRPQFSPAVGEVEWIPLEKHPIFSGIKSSSPPLATLGIPLNLLTWDGTSRLYVWDSDRCYLGRLSLRFWDHASIEAASSFKLFRPDTQLDFDVSSISINRAGSSLILAGLRSLCILYLYERLCTKDDIVTCRAVSVGSKIYFDDISSLRTLQASWHPYSDTHLGVLSSDSVFRLFDLSSNLERPEQEYYLQPAEPRSCHDAASICPMAFSFGGEHLWDRFSVFVLFSDGSIYVLCPAVPFGSFYSWVSIEEIYKDARMYGLKSSNPLAVTNSSLAIAWLEATFPELVEQTNEGGNLMALKAQPYVPFDASLALQGPLQVCHHDDEGSQIFGAKCEGVAVSFIYNTISKDSILVTVWSSGQLQIDALADELQPVWNVGTSPRISIDSSDQVLGVAMICEPVFDNVTPHEGEKCISNGDDTLWLGYSPPLLRLAVVDLALPEDALTGHLPSIFADPLVPERMFCLHSGGIDLIMLHFLPFSSHAAGKDEAAKSPSVYPLVTTCHGNKYGAPLQGFVAIADSFGKSWIVGLTSSNECVVVEMKDWNMVPSLLIDEDEKLPSYNESSDALVPSIISKELLIGPNVVLTAQASSSLRSLTADSIEGRSSLHHYFKLFHENYVEYAHKVYVELKHHVAYMEKALTGQHAQLAELKRMVAKIEEKQLNLDGKINRASQAYVLLQERLQSFRSLSRFDRKPLSNAEREFQSQLERYTGVELNALHCSIRGLDARLRRCIQPTQGAVSSSTRQNSGRRKNHVPNAQITQLKSAMERLSLVNSENAKKVKFVEAALKARESSKQ